MEEVIEADNVGKALKRVVQNKGSAGVDGMEVEALADHLEANWEKIRSALLTGTYQPQPVKKQTIEKEGGGSRELGIPTVLDRLVQQAILQVLQPRFDPTFSTHSYGFRPGRKAHDAVAAAQRFVQEGRDFVVDVDLEKFFDRINHDVLMSRLAHRIEDKRLLGLIRRFLNAGMMMNGVKVERHEGAPQGGPLSPLMANVLLDEVDKELERRGLAFCRYADDCNVYVRSQRAGDDAMATLRRLYGRLRLKVNEEKSAVGRPWERKFLGFTLEVSKKGKKVKRRVAERPLKKMKDRVREITHRNAGRSMEQVARDLRSYLLGWKAYFGFAEVRTIFSELDAWVRRRLRALRLKQWKTGRRVYRKLRGRGIASPTAAKIASLRSRYAHVTKQPAIFVALPDSMFDAMGVPRLAR
jgi:group II intron reverse transcriptase/maturase